MEKSRRLVSSLGFDIGTQFPEVSIFRQVSVHTDKEVQDMFVGIITHVHGICTLHVGDEHIQLQTGQVIQFDPQIPHRVDTGTDSGSACMIRVPVTRR
jgi:cupin superfamily acireductone dioxygenase involved in methionine salvage